MTTEEALQAYDELGRKIFGWQNLRKIPHVYGEHALERSVKELVSKRGMGDSMLDSSTSSGRGMAFVCAMKATDQKSPTRFRTFSVPQNDGPVCQIWQAARATTAASGYFKRILIEGHQ